MRAHLRSNRELEKIRGRIERQKGRETAASTFVHFDENRGEGSMDAHVMPSSVVELGTCWRDSKDVEIAHVDAHFQSRLEETNVHWGVAKSLEWVKMTIVSFGSVSHGIILVDVESTPLSKWISPLSLTYGWHKPSQTIGSLFFVCVIIIATQNHLLVGWGGLTDRLNAGLSIWLTYELDVEIGSCIYFNVLKSSNYTIGYLHMMHHLATPFLHF